MMSDQEKVLHEQLKGLNDSWIVVDFYDFKNFVMSGQDVLSEVIWKFVGNKLVYKCMDPANVALLIQNIETGPRSTHGVTGFDDLMLEVNHRSLAVFFKDLESSRKLTLKFHACDDRAMITLDGGFGSVDFFACIPSGEWPKVPELELKTKVRIDNEHFMALVALADKVSESVVVQVKEGCFSMRANGDLLMNLNMTQAPGIAKVSGPEAKAKFSIDYLKRVKLNKGIWTLSFSSDKILRIDDERGNSFLLAPRVDND